jgi:hypothetical protein
VIEDEARSSGYRFLKSPVSVSTEGISAGSVSHRRHNFAAQTPPKCRTPGLIWRANCFRDIATGWVSLEIWANHSLAEQSLLSPTKISTLKGAKPFRGRDGGENMHLPSPSPLAPCERCCAGVKKGHDCNQEVVQNIRIHWASNAKRLRMSEYPVVQKNCGMIQSSGGWLGRNHLR